ncbi:DUF2911 domain-containing protein [Geothrix sp. PMB-07]|uniref:DUF2911 domain-containing protein n=1 Tax=Geothrix sp. PMB-07 TaxID=3068640 RepID=UPI00274050A9|nr:DUF2911 domain-containing protein [Geothrix sp. PMB-07]WLT31191.1 DUF2911 domain-containing protein [Geothrix sp. PMB-07]
MKPNLVLPLLALAAMTVAAQQPAPAATAAPAATPAPAPRPAASPKAQAATQVAGKWAEPKPGAAPRYQDGKWITVDYSAPILRGRADIFGKGAEYGKAVSSGDPVWRAGANQTTRFKTEVPLVIGGKNVAAGEYSLFVELKEGAWTFILSSQPALTKWDANEKKATWGATNYDPKFDVVRVPMKLAKGHLSLDQLTFSFVNMTQQGGSLALAWDTQNASVDFKVAQ